MPRLDLGHHSFAGGHHDRPPTNNGLNLSLHNISYPTLALIHFGWWCHECRRGCCACPVSRHQVARLNPSPCRAVKAGRCLPSQSPPSVSGSPCNEAQRLRVGCERNLLKAHLWVLRPRSKSSESPSPRQSWGSSLWATSAFFVVHRESGSVPPFSRKITSLHRSRPGARARAQWAAASVSAAEAPLVYGAISHQQYHKAGTPWNSRHFQGRVDRQWQSMAYNV